MPIEILLPELSSSMEKGNIAAWLKSEGDVVNAGDAIAEIETDKATVELTSPGNGVLAKILAAAGSSGITINSVIGLIAGPGEDVGAVAANADKPSANPQRLAPKADAESNLASAGEGVGKIARSREAAYQQRILASPLARRLAQEANIDLAGLTGSGPHGRIVSCDIEAARHPPSQPLVERVPSSNPAPAVSDEQTLALFEEGSYEIVPHDNMRQIIAQRLTLAKQTIPHFYLTVECALEKLLALRAELNATAPKAPDGTPRYKLSINDFVIKALASALQQVPDANVTWTERGMLRHRHADIGVAVAISGGLLTPVIRQGDVKTLSAISIEMKDLAARARARKLAPREYQGGSAAISNLGMYAVQSFGAIVNPPHALILGVGAREERAIIRGGALKICAMMTVTMSMDHRAVDGATGAELITAFKQRIESPMAMIV